MFLNFTDINWSRVPRYAVALAILGTSQWPSQGLADPQVLTPVTPEQSSQGDLQREPVPTDTPPPASPVRRSPPPRPSELYIAGFGGYTFDTGSDLQGTGLGALGRTNLDLKDSGVFGAKIGYFMAGRADWFGIELEGFNTSPNVKSSTVTPAFPLPFPVPGVTVPGAHLRVTTVALNFIARAKLACRSGTSHQTSERAMRERDTEAEVNRPRFCPLQPYVGVGPGVYYAKISNQFGSESGATVGLNALAGVRYYFTEAFALFGEYKYNRASFSFDNIQGAGAGLDGTYSVSHLVGGLSVHF